METLRLKRLWSCLNSRNSMLKLLLLQDTAHTLKLGANSNKESKCLKTFWRN
jgi:hypothetical protein